MSFAGKASIANISGTGPSQAVLPSLRQEAGAGLSVKACSWFSTYRIHHRAASRFRAGRCFVLGDAAAVYARRLAEQRKEIGGLERDEQRMAGLVDKLSKLIKEQAEAASYDQKALAHRDGHHRNESQGVRAKHRAQARALRRLAERRRTDNRQVS